MSASNKKALSEREICIEFIMPALQKAGWDHHLHIREEVILTRGRVQVKGHLVSRAGPSRADYVLYGQPNQPIAVIEVKDNNQGASSGMQQALAYADMLDVPFIYSSNGDAFIEHDRTVTSGPCEREIPLDAFPSRAELLQRLQRVSMAEYEVLGASTVATHQSRGVADPVWRARVETRCRWTSDRITASGLSFPACGW